MEPLRFGPSQGLRWLQLIVAATFPIGAALRGFRPFDVVLCTLLVPALVLTWRADRSEFTAEGVRVCPRGLRCRQLPWSAIAEVRKVDRWQDGAVLVLRDGGKIKVPYVPRTLVPLLREQATGGRTGR